MSERTEGPGELDARLAEFDRRLREIQAELLAESGEPAATASAYTGPSGDATGTRARATGAGAPATGTRARATGAGAPATGTRATPTRTGAPTPVQSGPPEPTPLAPAPPPEAVAPSRSPRATHGRAGPLAELLAQLRAAPEDRRSELGDLRELVSSVRELLGGIESALARLESGEAAPVRREPEEATIAAGPFTTIEAVRAFERDVAALPGVQDAAVRGYEGAARAIIDVRLGTEDQSRGADL